MRLELSRSTIIVFAAGLIVYGMYWSYTKSSERNFDGGAQLEYIKYIVEHMQAPPASHCFV